ncbi:hypothetical protein SDC9_142341 [bioreactor metagenome]|uniref:Uncharacterized protein n=1 Tax=bioreactor metagenome TaxID=1076179 RepID=A0A645E1C7_9ZZZZ
MSSSGTSTLSCQVFSDGGSMTLTGRSPARNSATCRTGLTVADRPIRCGSRPDAARRSRLTARCAPRLVAARACTSSMMTVSTSLSVSAAALDSIRNSDSGVVIKMSGGWRGSPRRSLAGVSPERTATRTSGSGRPSLRAAACIPRSGTRRLRSTSTARAFSGEM